MRSKSKVELEILNELTTRGGSCKSAYALITRDLGRAWAHGYRCLADLERRGLIRIDRQAPPRPMTISLVK